MGLIGNADWVSGGFEGDAVSEPFEVGDQPSPVISPPRASAHHCACRYAQSSPTCFTSGFPMGFVTGECLRRRVPDRSLLFDRCRLDSLWRCFTKNARRRCERGIRASGMAPLHR